ncbi:tyrosine-type recombinase/integrase [Paramaledivibacter caminithermalis]|jgi:integrase/recombinase XerC|uniref:Integrase/recombinase XerC n=1 Tax=Paramaledivibacter caminithermalis (strain DSM 15212 / CIP 107654 / DViRD3) TaxID=1121301 RepID=A0A1M6M925_PARC5|nr:tyrosine-type recombinase/integrase [Paramaledivibacter caminithermalis]SHJ79932.1 integrase/recombinase XerC [Paramaledivibacter caminithermalis DSM 15212]
MNEKGFYMNNFMEYLKNQDKSNGTLKTYTLNILNFINYYQQTFDEEFIASNIILMDLQDWRTYMVTRGLKANTINNRIAAIKEYFTFLQNKSIIKTNPAISLKKIKLNNSIQKETFTLKEFKKIKRAIYKEGNVLDIFIFELFSKSGVRITEAINIKVSDLTITERIGGSNLRVIGKNRKERLIPLHLDIRKALESYLLWRNKHKFKDSTYLLLSERGEKFTRSGLYKRFLKYQYLTGIEIHPHKFRHFFASQIVKSNPINIAQELLGHSSVTTTQKYLSTEKEDIIAAVDSLENL